MKSLQIEAGTCRTKHTEKAMILHDYLQPNLAENPTRQTATIRCAHTDLVQMQFQCYGQEQAHSLAILMHIMACHGHRVKLYNFNLNLVSV